MKFVKDRIYQVNWLDHFSQEGVRTEDAAKAGEVVITTYGRMIHQDKDYIVLASHYEDKPQGPNNHHTHIIKNCIVKAKRLD